MSTVFTPEFTLLQKARILNKAGKFTVTGRKFLRTVAAESIATGSGGYSRFHGIETHGRGRFVTLSYSNYSNFRALLAVLNVDFTEGNDAPRGGKCGHYFEYKRADFLEALINFVEA